MHHHVGQRFAFSTMAVAGLICLNLLGAAPAQASHVGEALTLDHELVHSTDSLLAALKQWERMPAAQRAAATAQLVQLAQARQSRLLDLIQADASVAATRMLPMRLRAKLPAAAQPFVEEAVKVRGEAAAQVSDDFERGRSKVVFKLLGQGGGTELDIYLADPTGSARDLSRVVGRKVVMDAMRVGDKLVVVDRKQMQLEAANGNGGGGSTDPLAAGAVVLGNQKTLSILLNFSDKTTACSAADVSTRLFASSGASVNNNFAESSGGKVTFSGQVIGPFPINYTSTGSCNYAGWASAADAAAKAAGFDPAQYQRVNYVTPGNSSCGWSGLAYMPGKQSWVQSCTATGLFSHELGHNLSLHHAATPTSEYGDGSDPMGGARLVGHNGANRVMAGWMPTGTVQDVGVGGSYALASLSTNAGVTSPQVLRLPKVDTAETYYVSLRTPVSLDSALTSTYVNKLSIHRATGSLPTRTYLLQNLSPGQSFVDATNGLTITHQGQNGDMATVAVAYGNGNCTRSAPIVSASPSSQTSAPGASIAYTVSVSNTNSAACGTGSFAMAQAMPSGVSGSFAASSLAIPAGASASTTWTVAAASTLANGTYTLTASAGEASGGSGSGHGSLVVYADSVAPTVAITSPSSGATVSGNNITIQASASDDNGVQAVEFYVDGALLARDTSGPYSARWNLRKVAPGAHTLTVRAIDQAGNVAQSSIGVTVK